METAAEVRTGPRQLGWQRGDPTEAMITDEWLVTNGLGGYASGTVGGACTRRFHGLLIASLRAPAGRTMMFNHLEETLEGPDGLCWKLSGDETGVALSLPAPDFLEELALERGLPVWRFSKGGIRLEKRVVMPHLQNTTYIVYRMMEGPPGLALKLRPSLHFRPHEGLLSDEMSDAWELKTIADRDFEITDGDKYPALKLSAMGASVHLIHDVRTFTHRLYRIEKSRGYEHEGGLWSPGVLRIELAR